MVIVYSIPIDWAKPTESYVQTQAHALINYKSLPNMRMNNVRGFFVVVDVVAVHNILVQWAAIITLIFSSKCIINLIWSGKKVYGKVKHRVERGVHTSFKNKNAAPTTATTNPYPYNWYE